MGIFGFNAEKKVAQAERLLSEGKYFDARDTFEEVLQKAKSGQVDERRRAKAGERSARQNMIEGRIAEARAHMAVGETAAARGRLEVALDLAGEDIDLAPIESVLQELAEPEIEPSTPAARPKAVPEVSEQKPHEDQISRDELLASDPMNLFELYMNGLSAPVVELFRSQPEVFQLGYVASHQGAPRLALEYFEQCRWDPLPPDPITLERAQVDYALGRGEDALGWLDQMEAKDEPGPLQLRVAVLRDLGRFESSIETAIQLTQCFDAPNPAADATLAWAYLAAGRAAESWECLEGWVGGGTLDESLLVPASQALLQLGRTREAAQTLENLIHYRLHLSLQHEEEPNFPVEAGRRLLNLYLSDEFKSDPQVVRTLVLHLLDFDVPNAEIYRGLLLS